MPDVWTFNRVKLKKMLSESGNTCGEAPRVVKDRDPEWTCHLQGPDWYGDIYIHQASLFVGNHVTVIYSCLLLVIGISLGYVIAARVRSKI